MAQLFRMGETRFLTGFDNPEISELLRQAKDLQYKDLSPIYSTGFHEQNWKRERCRQLIARMNGEEEISYILPCMEPILKDTLGLIVYQEQIICIIMVVAGINAIEAYQILKYMDNGFNQLGDNSEYFNLFIEKGINNSYSSKSLNMLWNELIEGNRYALKKPHCVAHTLTIYRLAWLKCRYQDEFYTAAQKYLK